MQKNTLNCRAGETCLNFLLAENMFVWRARLRGADPPVAARATTTHIAGGGARALERYGRSGRRRRRFRGQRREIR